MIGSSAGSALSVLPSAAPGAPPGPSWAGGAAPSLANISADQPGPAVAVTVVSASVWAKADSDDGPPGAPVPASKREASRRCSGAGRCSVAFARADALFLRRQSITELAAARGVSGPSPPAL